MSILPNSVKSGYILATELHSCVNYL